MRDYDSRPLFSTFCKMTCIGGSEVGECPCTHPKQCEISDHPEYEKARRVACTRLKIVAMQGKPN